MTRATAIALGSALALVACSETIEVLNKQGERCACPAGQACIDGRCVAPTRASLLGEGHRQTCYIAEGELYCWGSNTTWQLGLGDATDRARPARVGDADDWVDVQGGQQHTCGVREGGRMFCWGDNMHGQLGMGDFEARTTPALVPGFEDWDAVYAGGDNTCGLRDGGTLYCWGDNLEGKVGLADAYDAPDVNEPARTAGDTRYRHADIGQGHACAIDVDGALYCWGRRVNGETGTGNPEGHSRAPERVGSALWRDVAASQHHSCGVRDDGSVWCWGETRFGELGIGVIGEGPDDFFATPERVEVAPAQAIAVGWFHSCALAESGALSCWGRAVEGQLGDDGQGTDPIPTPTQVGTEEDWSAIVTGHFHSCGLRDGGALYCWGQNTVGQLGIGDLRNRDRPIPVALP